MLDRGSMEREGMESSFGSAALLTMPHPLVRHPPSQDPPQRLGAQAGADEVRQHPWFAEVDWALGRHSEATLARAASRGPKRAPSKAASKAPPGIGSNGRGSGAAPPTPKRAGEGGTVMGCFPMRRRRS